MNYQNMNNISIGVLSNTELKMTARCIRHWLNRECNKISGLLSTPAGMLQFVQVCDKNKFKTPNHFQGVPLHPISINEAGSGSREQNGTWTGALGQLHAGSIDMLATSMVSISNAKKISYLPPPSQLRNTAP